MESQFDIVRNTHNNQAEHHKSLIFKHEFESLLKSNHIEIDDFVWQD